jgi:hypothetical protein
VSLLIGFIGRRLETIEFGDAVGEATPDWALMTAAISSIRCTEYPPCAAAGEHLDFIVSGPCLPAIRIPGGERGLGAPASHL